MILSNPQIAHKLSRTHFIFGKNPSRPAPIFLHSGTAFTSTFNTIYYSFSPAIADLERDSPIFKEMVKTTITPMLSTLSILNYVDIDSEQEMLGYGIGIILLNLGMYFVAPAIIIIKIKSILQRRSSRSM